MFGLHLKNYKSFEDQKFDFSKINILIGTNSSGKSAVLKFFLMLKQSLINKELVLTLNHAFQLGSYKNIITDGDTSKSLFFSFHLSTLFYQWLNNENINHNSDEICIDIELGNELNNISNTKIEIHSKNIGKLSLLNIKSNLLRTEGFCDLIFENTKSERFEYLKRKFTRNSFIVTPDISDISDDNAKELNYLVLSLYYLLDILQEQEYINPLYSSKPCPLYTKQDDLGLTPTPNLEAVIQVMTSENIAQESKNIVNDKFKQIIKDFSIAEEIEITDIANAANEIKVKVKADDDWRNITDVGLGVALSLPILVQTILSNEFTKNGETILLEQPEIHIHPKLQAKLMEVLVKYGEKNTYFIETHSIHFIEALQVMVKEKKVKKEDITIHYLTKENNRTKVSIHKIDDDGFLNTPISEDFMDVSYNLTSKLLS